MKKLVLTIALITIPAIAAHAEYVKVWDKLNVRADASPTAIILDTLPRKHFVIVQKKNNGWAYIKYVMNQEYRYGWVKEEFLENDIFKVQTSDDPKKLAYFKDLVYIPIAHLNLNKNIDFVDGGGWGFNIGRPIIKKEIFDNAEFISKEIINFQPRSILDNCVIEKYQAQEVPKFLIWLKQLNPDLFNEVKKINQDNKVFENLSNIGRQAKLVTLTPNVGKFVDIHGGIWVWDGEYIASKNSKVSFTLVESKDTEECKLKPNKNAVVKITDENQVNENTIFIS